MSMSPSEMQHKIRQLDNDVQAIYVMLSEIQGTQRRHTNRFQELAEMVAGHESRFDSIDARLTGHDTRLDSIDGKLDSVLDILRAGGGGDR